MAEAQAHRLPLRDLLEGARIIGHEGDLDVAVCAVRHDSRAVEPGDVFFALDGEQVRGLDFAGQAIERGALAVVASTLASFPALGLTAVVAVDEVRRVMARAACVASGHPTRAVPTVGITGTNGKTTITYLVESACRAADIKAGVIGTINARLGERAKVLGFTTPEAPELQRTAAELVGEGGQALLIEVTSHGLKLERVHGCTFKVVAFTNLTQDHLDLHGSMEDYADTKLRLFGEALEFSQDAVAVVNIDDPLGERVRAEATCPVTTVSAAGATGADIRVLEKVLTVQGVRAEIEVAGHGSIAVSCPLIGEHNVSNLAVALGIACALGVPMERAAEGFAALEKVPGRVEPVDDPRGSAVLVDYAHTPDALGRVTEATAAFTKGRLLVVFGCGGDRDQTKRPQMAAAAAAGGDIVVVTSDNPRTEDPQAIIDMALPGVENSGLPRVELDEIRTVGRGYAVEPDRRRAIYAAVSAARPDDVVLIAGKGHEDYQILGRTKVHFDDREEAAEAIKVALSQGGRRGPSYEA